MAGGAGRRGRARAVLVRWLPALVIVAVINALSARPGLSGESVNRWAHEQWPRTDRRAVARVQLLLRKNAHVAEYVALGAALTHAGGEAAIRTWRGPAGLTLVGAGFAALDEFHQGFVRGRVASGRDVLLDCAGLVVGLLLARAIRRRRAL
ncbi:MAG: VanZ family protein, partial [Clostridia bacterium]|nr:VanZ family protein [Clostridia bacterium]